MKKKNEYNNYKMYNNYKGNAVSKKNIMSVSFSAIIDIDGLLTHICLITLITHFYPSQSLV